MDKYEISIWEDYSDETPEGKKFLNERKIAVIGSDTMEAQARALEPNLVEEINGTHTFTFKMFYTYVDNETGETYSNPFGKYLINERKVKVLWKNQWYDLVIKKCQEDTSKKSITYTCTDLFINELSKQGYSLEFDIELENNIGTAAELAKTTLEGSTWQYDDEASTPIIQKTEGPVYEVIVDTDTFSATRQDPNGNVNYPIPIGAKILVFYDSIVDVMDGAQNVPVQFLYAAEGYKTDVNDQLVINGDCYQIIGNCVRNGEYLQVSRNSILLFSINLVGGVSENYRAKRLVRSQKSEYDALLDRYVLLCTDNNGNEVYEIATTEYTNPLAVTNLIANPTEFTSVQGWIGRVDEFGVFPKFGSSTIITDYAPKSYLKILNGDTYNTGIQSNISVFQPTELEIKDGIIGGIQAGEQYIFRIKLKTDNSGAPGNNYVSNVSAVIGNMYKYNTLYQKTGSAIFSRVNAVYTNDHWIESTMTALVSISASQIEEYGLFITSNGTYWIEDVQFFKYTEGATSYEEDAEIKRINPGEIALQSIVTPVYKYYYKENNIEKPEDLTYLYVGIDQNSKYKPVYNNYEKIGTINERESNRFNILQSIAETFQAWVKFRIDHEDNGAIKFIDGVPQKWVYFVEEIGDDTGLSFEYGIDLKTINRTIDSDKLATKVIVKANDNEYAPNGFCSIAQSDQNYAKESFILNLDYFTQQNLISREELQKDLYSTQEGYIGYYYWLHKWNKEYDNNTDELKIKNLDLTRQTAQREVYEQYLLAAREQLEVIESDLKNLAGVSQWADAQTYARTHASNEKVQSLLNAHGVTENEINKYEQLLTDINITITKLETHIQELQDKQQELLILLAEKHKEFNDKYSTYIMEGTWQDENYVYPDEYFLDGLNVAYTSSRPQLSYNINVLRVSSLDEYSSKIFNLGDICYMQDREFFGYLPDKITPYKEKILVSKISSFFDQPEKDIITVQNYKSRFDDLFQRIAATTQSLQYQEGSFARAAGMINPDGTLSFAALQDTFDANADLVLNSSNQDVTWDDTGITVTNKFNSADKTKIIAGGIFVTNDGGQTWKNAIRGDGISTDLLTAGRVNTSEIYIYDGNAPSFRWDSDGLTAYSYDSAGTVNFGKFVRHDKYGIYGYDGNNDFIPTSENDIWNNSKFGLTWKGFFLKSQNGNNSFEISTDNDLVITSNGVKRVQIGRLNGSQTNYGLELRDANNNVVFKVDSSGANIAGWTMNNNSIYKTVGTNTIGLFSSGKNATINGHNDNYYILAGNSFGVTVDGKIYARAGKIGNWDITDTTLQNQADSTHYLRLRSDSTGAFIEGMDGSKNYWYVGKNGRFNFVDGNYNTSDTSEIRLGPTTINNHYIYTTNLSAGGGSIGGCSISGGGISGGGWNLGAGGLSINGTTVNVGGLIAVQWVSASLSTSGSQRTHFSVSGTVPEGGGQVTLYGDIDIPTYKLSGNYAYVTCQTLRTSVTGIVTQSITGGGGGA